MTKASVLRAQGDPAGAAALVRKAIDLQPEVGERYRLLGQLLMTQGLYKEALETFQIARQKIAPSSAGISFLHSNMAVAFLANDRFPEAIEQARLAIAEFSPKSGTDAEIPWIVLIAAEAANGQDPEARADWSKFLSAPRTLLTVAKVTAWVGTFPRDPKLLEGLRRVGMPVE